ncbi:MAG: hypothetical protein JOZ90_01980 [Alphaproteobacteria bacterium]|nr:hypothetical protein [Alphaproteobacteria bacterium]MBV9370773.1 hypothetical protein [Alphaproteobacteria bacterium]MBV9899846.1 hypothetical protein [Alphaproteobacteria bacterium]
MILPLLLIAFQAPAGAGAATPPPRLPHVDPAGCRTRPSNRIIVQGGVAAIHPENDPQAGTGAVAIGPKQDDPRAIGPKQDDPASGGHGMVAIGPKQDDPASGGHGMLAIGPKQDDPSPPPSSSLRLDACPAR